MIREYSHVRIRTNGIEGTVVDVCEAQGKTVYAIESDRKGTPGGFGYDGDWKIYHCLESELEVI